MAYLCEYIDKETFLELDDASDHIVAQVVRMSEAADRWAMAERPKRK